MERSPRRCRIRTTGPRSSCMPRQTGLYGKARTDRHYTDSIPYESKRLFYELRYMDICKKYMNSMSRTEMEEAEELDS